MSDINFYHKYDFVFCLTAQKFQEATDFYSQAIDINPFVAAYYGNRSFAHLKTECFGSALQDATQALSLDRNYIKVMCCLSSHSIHVF